MTPELHTRLERSLPPFDGDCIHNLEDLSLTQLRSILVAAVEILVAAIDELRNHFPVVYSFHDWHEHDGFVVKHPTDDWRRMNLVVTTTMNRVSHLICLKVEPRKAWDGKATTFKVPFIAELAFAYLLAQTAVLKTLDMCVGQKQPGAFFELL